LRQLQDDVADIDVESARQGEFALRSHRREEGWSGLMGSCWSTSCSTNRYGWLFLVRSRVFPRNGLGLGWSLGDRVSVRKRRVAASGEKARCE
jgi:hypothetical protein